jgi:hypothetical protein
MHFDSTVTLGTLLTVAVTLGSFGVFVFKMFAHLAKLYAKNAALEYKVNIMWNHFKREHKIDDAGKTEQ